jgi:hypothetical protein
MVLAPCLAVVVLATATADTTTLLLDFSTKVLAVEHILLARIVLVAVG